MPWIEAATLSDFDATDRKYCELTDDVQAALFKHEDGGFYAVEVWCSHQKVSLMNGDLEDYELMCPLHGACFDIRTGKHLSLPAVKPIASYPVRVDGDTILIEVPDA
jgi:3-phenylpropionate/trans-cinnamate dioxygenase ferredoxin subunit